MDRAETWEVFVVEMTGLMCSGPKTNNRGQNIYVCVYVYICVYIYICVICVFMCVCICIYV